MKHKKLNKNPGLILNDPPIEVDTELALEAIREVYDEDKKSKEIVRQKRLNTPLRNLVTDADTNALYMSAVLKTRFPEFSEAFERILHDHQLPYHYFRNTRDIWCRDYMPVQLDRDNLMQFRYDPYYLRYKKYRGTHTIGADALPCDIMLADECDIVLDGGNVVSCGNKVIVSEVIFRDNPGRDKRALIAEIEGIFRHPVIVIPRIPGEFSGHTDGMVRFYQKDMVLVNDYAELISANSKKTASRLMDILVDAGFRFVSVPYFPNENANHTSAYGCYLNYLRMGKKVFLPVFGNKKQDEMALHSFRELYQEVIPVPSREIAAKGGVLNCISWTIKKSNYGKDH